MRRHFGSNMIALAIAAVVVPPAEAQFRVPDTLTAEQASRFAQFEDFQIKGVCGDRDLERLSTFGVNTVRGYTIPAETSRMTARLDEAHALGMKMVVSEWMPHHGENKDNRGGSWNFDYDARRETMVSKFIKKVDAIGDHPAILMWGLGNEVHLDEPYLRTVNRMSEAIHERFPNHITSLTMVNAKPEHIEAVQRWAPDLDVIGAQSYSPGAVRNSIRNLEEHWGKPFYMSEFNGKGPWNFAKTDWGEAYDETVDQKVADLAACYDAIDRSSLCLGSTVFVWGHFRNNRPTYFSLLLDEHPDGSGKNQPVEDLLITPQAELMVEHFKGEDWSGNRAPIITRIEPASGARDITAAPDERVSIRLAATDPDGDRITFRCWILDSKPSQPRTVAGPFESTSAGLSRFAAPGKSGDYLIMAYALDGRGGGSASTIPLAVR